MSSMTKEEFKDNMLEFQRFMKWDATDMAELFDVGVDSVNSYRVGRSCPRPKRREQLVRLMTFLYDREASRRANRTFVKKQLGAD